MVEYPAFALFEDAFEDIKNAESVEKAVFALRDRYGLANVTYHLAQTVQGSVDAPYVRTTYPAAWVARYLLKDYVKVDPIVREGFSRQLPFDWSEVEITPAAYELMTEAIKNGVGPAGYSMPVTDKAGRRALVSFNSTVAGEVWSELVTAHREHWAELAQLLHRKAVVEVVEKDDAIPALGPRELECLYWSGQGKEAKEIAILLQISENTTRDYLKSARHKLQCSNITKAVTTAIRLRLINP
jgi:LuxR family transcriptional regulator, quorum-sensing system regulator CinR